MSWLPPCQTITANKFSVRFTSYYKSKEQKTILLAARFVAYDGSLGLTPGVVSVKVCFSCSWKLFLVEKQITVDSNCNR